MKKLTLKDEKGVRVLKKKKTKKANTQLEEILGIVKAIESKNKSKNYTIITNNRLAKYLNLLSGHEFFELIKFNIALNTVFDSSVDYQYSEQFLEGISELLFDDTLVIKQIQKNLWDIYIV